jgi:large subunit ribosomal protein L19
MFYPDGGKLLPSARCGDKQQGHFFRERKEVMNILDKIEAEQLKKEVTKFGVGDTVKVHTRVIEGDKERIQIYAGIVIGRKGTGVNENFTVRRVSYGEGVERVFPLHSPRIAKIEVEKKGAVRRARLNYLRSRKGKSATTVKEKARASAETAA